VSQKRSILHLCLYYQFTAVKTGSRQRLGVWRAERSFASSRSHSLNNHAVGVRLELRCRRTRRDSSNSVHASSEHSSCAVALVSGLVAVVGSHRWKPRLLPLPRRTCERAVTPIWNSLTVYAQTELCMSAINGNALILHMIAQLLTVKGQNFIIITVDCDWKLHANSAVRPMYM